MFLVITNNIYIPDSPILFASLGRESLGTRLELLTMHISSEHGIHISFHNFNSGGYTGLSRRSDHYKLRSDCVNKFVADYFGGNMPLRYTSLIVTV